jgi:hypothetical protein
MYLPSERIVVNGVGLGSGVRYSYNGLGELEGMFNIGKMFTRMFTFTPSSFKFKNIAGAIGSGLTTFGTFGIANVASEFAGPSGLGLTKGTITGAHSKPMEYVGYAGMAAAAAAGVYFGGGALLSAVGPGAGAGGAAIGTASSGSSVIGAATGQAVASTWTVGGVLSSIGSGLTTVLKALPLVGGLMGGIGGGGGQPQQQGGMTQAEYDAQQKAAYDAGQQAQAQAVYEAQVRAQQAQMYQPGAMPASYDMGQPSMTGMNASYGDLRTPYTAITEDGQQIQVDPTTGQVIPEGMSTGTMIVLGGVTLLAGWYLMSGSKSTN